LLTAAIIVITTTVLYARIRLLGTPLERDEGEYAYIGQLLLHGSPPYNLAYTMKLPGTAMVYAFFMSLFGQSAPGIHSGLLLVNIANALLVFMLGKRLFNRDTATIAAAFYALLSVSENVLGVAAHATHFVTCFALGGIVLLQRALSDKNRYLVFVSGLCFGTALLMKQHALLFIPFAFWFQVWHHDKPDLRRACADSALLCLGVALPYIALLSWLLYAGTFARFWFWTMQYARQYTGELSLSNAPAVFYSQFQPIMLDQFLIWFLAGCGALITGWNTARRGTPPVLLGLLAFSFLMICPGFYFRPHYFVLMLPAVALLAAYAATSAGDLAGKIRAGSYTVLLPPLLVAIAALSGIYSEKDYLLFFTPQQASRHMYGLNPFPEALEIADYIRRNSTEKETVAILGSEPEILFYADRRSATGHLYMYGLMEKHIYAGEMQSELIREIEAAQPAFVVVVHTSASWLLRRDTENRILEWGDDYLGLRYDEVGIVEIGDDKTRFLWDDATKGHDPETDSFVSVYRRRW
jgi:hypothetical protein